MKTFIVYSTVIVFIVSWWALAFAVKPAGAPSGDLPVLGSTVLSDGDHGLEHKLSPFDRHHLQDALSGNFDLMSRFIIEWDIDARLLMQAGIPGIQRLSKEDYLRSQELARLLRLPEEVLNQNIKVDDSSLYLIDDSGKSIELMREYSRFLPQTYAAATYLLAIAPLDKIVALPRKMREQTLLFPKEVTDKIPLDIDRHNGEKVFQKKPDIAFVAHYSHPATIQALSNQGVVLFTMRNLTTIEDITDELMRIGAVIRRPVHAEMLKLFINAAILALDNRQMLLISQYERSKQALPRIVVANYHQTLSLPSQRTLTGQLLLRMQRFDITEKYVADREYEDDWMVPIDKERLVNIDPDCLIIATDNREAVEAEIRRDPAMKRLAALRHNKLYFVDEAIHHSTTQYIVLAYLDLLQALDNKL